MPIAAETLAASRILIVDDEPANVLLLRRVLERRGYHALHTTTDPRQALPLVAEQQPDLVLLDLHMPHVDGFAILSEIVSRAGDEYLPVLVITADATPQARERALSTGARDFVTKPFDFAEIVLRVGNLLETRHLQRALQRQAAALEQRVLERTAALEEALARAEAASRAKSQFLANISHELRTPLTALRGSIGLLGRAAGGALPPAAARLLEISGSNTERLARLVEDLLLLQSLDSGEARPGRFEVNVAAVVNEVVQNYASRADQRGVRLGVQVPGALRPLLSDGSCLREILERLLDNAVRFTEAGEVCVRVIAADGDAAAVEVADTGPGIAPDRLRSIFDRFEQADNSDARAHGGLGLGLTIARGTAELLGFRLRAESEPGRGSTFVLELSAEGNGEPAR
ncbi:hybrid sensor histidine kinase/response regulator [Longimicrobium sp.]|jgi:signal transduction histidine kinase|uniref:hybrid sensor histidine kinase/response regulator n=1 Tax=Longimicrobium sp. TaxID=2029185 RepID=UPI002F95FB9A